MQEGLETSMCRVLQELAVLDTVQRLKGTLPQDKEDIETATAT